MNTPLFELKEVSYTYEDGTEALQKINLQIDQGKKIALLGSNGAGKSTLILHLNGLLKPTSGTIYFKGQPLSYSKKELLNVRRKVGIVFQNPETQLFNGTVLDDIAYGPFNLHLAEQERKSLIEKAINQTDVESLLDKPIHFLSVGQKKRVSIAGVLAMDPEVIILDEPTASLDIYYTRKIRKLLNELHCDGRTLILSTHDIDFAYEWADEVVVMHHGEMLYHGAFYRLFEENKDIVKKANLETSIIFEIAQMMKMQGLISKLDDVRSKEKVIDVLHDCFMKAKN
ncbi:energy-coupling factor ABC transporter ATP-binding protein [Ureibacillus thermosphaericus]|uniref:energy-coupling factor ABC transporter ATP-binding protein n=1 Tax=Ureibacillus thermosphaericus TaxID=51173 RepID=UPI000BBC738E|nr:ABC transporter ATP-binding protein [Ureibacillus thermosphaericus]